MYQWQLASVCLKWYANVQFDNGELNLKVILKGNLKNEQNIYRYSFNLS